MKVWEIVKMGGEIINSLQKSCMSMDDCRYVGMYEEYMGLMNDGARIPYWRA